MRSLALLLILTGSLLQAQRTPSVRATGEGVVAATSLAVTNRVKALIGTSEDFANSNGMEALGIEVGGPLLRQGGRGYAAAHKDRWHPQRSALQP